MIIDIARHEWLLHRRRRLTAILLSLMTALLLLALFAHVHHQRVLEQSQQLWQQQNDQLWQQQPDRHPHRVAHYGQVVFRPVAPLSFLDSGATPFVGNYLFLEAHRQNSSAIRNNALSPGIMMLGFPSVSTLMLIVWPLVLLILACAAFSDDRETGRMAWIVSTGAPLWKRFLGKALVYLTFTAAMLLLIVVASLIVLQVNDEALSSSTLLELLALLAIYALHAMFWISAILLISLHARSSSQSLFTGLTVWVLLVAFLPKLAVSLAESVYPTPDRANFDRLLAEAVSEAGDSHNPDDPHFAEFRQRVLQQYKVESIDQLPVNWNGLVMAEGERLTSEIFSEQIALIDQQFDRQQSLYSALALLSPTMMATQLSRALTRNDRAAITHFDLSAEGYRYQLIQQLNDLHTHEIHRANDRAQKVDQSTWQNMATFRYQPESSPAIFDRNGEALMQLMLWCLLWLPLAWYLKRYEVAK